MTFLACPVCVGLLCCVALSCAVQISARNQPRTNDGQQWAQDYHTRLYNLTDDAVRGWHRLAHTSSGTCSAHYIPCQRSVWQQPGSSCSLCCMRCVAVLQRYKAATVPASSCVQGTVAVAVCGLDSPTLRVSAQARSCHCGKTRWGCQGRAACAAGAYTLDELCQTLTSGQCNLITSPLPPPVPCHFPS